MRTPGSAGDGQAQSDQALHRVLHPPFGQGPGQLRVAVAHGAEQRAVQLDDRRAGVVLPECETD